MQQAGNTAGNDKQHFQMGTESIILYLREALQRKEVDMRCKTREESGDTTRVNKAYHYFIWVGLHYTLFVHILI